MGGSLVGIEGPAEHDLILLRAGAGGPVGGQSGRVVGIRQHPHAVAAVLSGQVGEGADEGPADAAVAVLLVYGELVEEHLGAFVGCVCSTPLTKPIAQPSSRAKSRWWRSAARNLSVHSSVGSWSNSSAAARIVSESAR